MFDWIGLELDGVIVGCAVSLSQTVLSSFSCNGAVRPTTSAALYLLLPLSCTLVTETTVVA